MTTSSVNLPDLLPRHQSESDGLVSKQKWLKAWEENSYQSNENNTPLAEQVKIEEQQPPRVANQPVSAGAMLAVSPQVLNNELADIQLLNNRLNATDTKSTVSIQYTNITKQSNGQMQITISFEASPLPRTVSINPKEELLSVKQKLIQNFEKTVLKDSNMHLSIDRHEVNIWLRDYRKGSDQRVMTAISDIKAVLKKHGYVLGTVKVNGQKFQLIER